MSFLSPADITQLRGVAELPFLDRYDLLRKPATATKDAMGNRTNAAGADFRVVESGPCRLRQGGLRPSEQVIADRLGTAVAYAIDMPLTTIATPEDRIQIDGRTLQVGGVIREGALAMVATAVCEERG